MTWLVGVQGIIIVVLLLRCQRLGSMARRPEARQDVTASVLLANETLARHALLGYQGSERLRVELERTRKDLASACDLFRDAHVANFTESDQEKSA